MRRDGRLSRMLHVLVHMDKRGGKATSETIALMLGTNPVVVRRTMGTLKAAGIVSSEGGHGGGWTLVRDLGAITVRDVYLALGAPPALALEAATDHSSCPVEQSAVAALETIFGETEAFMLLRMGEISLADIGQDFERRVRLAQPR
ncbi:Rrf2 family transcriptional regulator [Massilia sp. HP4]|uniref:Rrf2 family transcriptional regulator n=1 Tax=Massilia sp. HP4 TaxID=2562316 RepID=UPI0010BF874B|nr:Rrf2 family transcriptional regulator [Massilia sp. HP4]